MSEHRGYFIVEEQALRKLRSTYDRQSAYRLAWMVYVTLCRVGNLEGSEVFIRAISSIAQDAGLSYNAAAEGLSLVQSAGLVKVESRNVEGTKEKAPSQYTLVRMFPTECGTSPTESGTSPTEKGRLPKTRNSQDLPIFPNHCPSTIQSRTKREASPSQSRFTPPSLSEAEAEAVRNGMPASEGQAFIDHHQAKGWVIGKSPMKDWRAAMRTWKRNWQKFQANGTRNGAPKQYAPVAGDWGTP